MIFITGDTHGNEDFGKLAEFASEHSELNRSDYVIIAGDFGAVWNSETLVKDLKPYSDLPFTVLFVDGNHENFPLLNTFPEQMWNGGKIHKIRENIFHLMRGQVYEIEGKRFFTFGGATSIDKIYRRENISWWSEEVPTDRDIQEANKNLEKVGYKVDYIVTHSCDERALYYPPLNKRTFQTSVYPENLILSYFEEKVEYLHWYFGHYHLDGDLTDKKTVVYQNVIRMI
ncbi:MAG: metallophosphoesterase [Clostridia bacterium]|nr:metallophosphoesterase [Clostridia bacterium]